MVKWRPLRRYGTFVFSIGDDPQHDRQVIQDTFACNALATPWSRRGSSQRRLTTHWTKPGRSGQAKIPLTALRFHRYYQGCIAHIVIARSPQRRHDERLTQRALAIREGAQ
jgi:hypothetical protein